MAYLKHVKHGEGAVMVALKESMKQMVRVLLFGCLDGVSNS